MEAAAAGDSDCVRLLLDNGADANLPTASGHLPIHRAALAGHYQ